MNLRFTIPVQWSITLLIGLFLGYSYQLESVPIVPVVHQTPTGTVLTPTPSPAPFVTMPGGLLVRVKFFRNDAPQVEKITYLTQARIIVYPKGSDQIGILNDSGQVIYAQLFVVEFLDGDPPQPVDSKTVIFVLPLIENASKIVITTSSGKAIYDIPEK
jgi:hypothetical protein